MKTEKDIKDLQEELRQAKYNIQLLEFGLSNENDHFKTGKHKVFEEWEIKKEKLKEEFSKDEPEVYKDIVEKIALLLSESLGFVCRGHRYENEVIEIGVGNVTGENIYIIKCDETETAWISSFEYGSCSGCDAMESARYIENKDERIKDFMTIALHITQSLRKIR